MKIILGIVNDGDVDTKTVDTGDFNYHSKIWSGYDFSFRATKTTVFWWNTPEDMPDETLRQKVENYLMITHRVRIVNHKSFYSGTKRQENNMFRYTHGCGRNDFNNHIYAHDGD